MSKKSSSLYNQYDNEVLSSYLEAIDRIPLLSYEEEYELALKAKEGDKKARDKIISANLRFVVSVAKKYRGQGMALEDLINEGNIGLVTAIDKFEPEKGYHFISYAVWWIRQSILKALAEQSRPIRLPLNRSNELISISRAKKALETKGIVNPTLEEIAQESGVDRESVKSLIDITKDMVSLDAPVRNDSGSDEETNLENFVQDKAEDPEKCMISNMMSEDVGKLLSTLSEKEKDIIKKRFGFNHQEPMSLSAIGSEYNLTKERIRQIEKSALDKLKRNGEEKGIKYYNVI